MEHRQHRQHRQWFRSVGRQRFDVPLDPRDHGRERGDERDLGGSGRRLHLSGRGLVKHEGVVVR